MNTDASASSIKPQNHLDQQELKVETSTVLSTESCKSHVICSARKQSETANYQG